MATQPQSAVLRDTIARLDASIIEAKQLHAEAVAASHEAVAVNITLIADSGVSDLLDLDDIAVPSTTSTAARLEDLLRKREIAEYVMARAQESERLEKDGRDRITLANILGRLMDHAKLADAATLAAVDAIATMQKTAAEADNHLRHVMGRNPLPQNAASEAAKAIGAAIGRSTHWNAEPLKPIATARAEEFARSARNEAGGM